MDRRDFLLPLIAALVNWRSRWSGVATGDQAIFVSRGAYEAAGGFPVIPLMEDVALARSLRRRSRPDWLARAGLLDEDEQVALSALLDRDG
jgi:hypothetical protein